MRKNVTLLVILIGLLFPAGMFGQSVVAQWNLTANGVNSSISTGINAAAAVSFTNTAVSNVSPPSATGYSTNYGQSWAKLASGLTFNSSYSATNYIQVSIDLASSYTLTFNGITADVGIYGGTGGGLRYDYSTDNTTYSQIGVNVTNAIITTKNIMYTNTQSLASPVTVASGGTLYLRIYTWNTSTSARWTLMRNFKINGTLNNVQPNLTLTGSLTPFSQISSTPSATQSYTISGALLTSDVTVTPPDGIEVSSNGGSSWWTNSSPLVLGLSGSNIAGQPVTISVRLNKATAGLVSGNITHVSGTATGDVSVTGTRYISYYSASSGSLEQLTSWGANSDGTGSNPANFTADYQTYIIGNNAAPTIAGDWVVSGTSSKVVVGDGSAAVNFTIPSTNTLTGTIDVQNNATLTLENTVLPTIGSLASASTVVFSGNTVPAQNFGNLTLANSANLSGTGSVGVAGTFNPGTTTAATSGSTIAFNGTSAQTVPAFSYYNLNINNASSIANGSTAVLQSGGTLTIANSKSLTVNGILDNQSVNAVAFGTGSSLVVTSGAEYWANVVSTKIPAAATFQAGSNLRILNSLDGSIGLPSSIGGNVIVNYAGALGAWTKATGNSTIGGNLTVLDGIFNNGTGGTSRTLIVQGNMTVSGGQYDVAGAAGVTTNQTLTIAGNLTVDGGILYASNNTTTGAVGTINIGGNLVHTAGALGAGVGAVGGKIVFNGSALQSISSVGLENNPVLTINNSSSAGVNLASDLSYNGALTFTNGVLSLGSFNLTLGEAATIAGSPSSATMVFPNGTGQIRKVFTNSGSFTFPIGDVSGTNEYAPVTMNASADAYSSAYVTVKTTRSKHPNNTSVSDYLNRYWTVSASGFSNPVYSATFAYTAADVAGNESLIFGAHYSNSTWENVGVVNIVSHSFATPSFTVLGDFTCADGSVVPTSPVITVSATGLSFGRVNRNTSSAEQTYSVTGYYLTPASGDVTITAPANFEVSTSSGSGFSSSVTLPYTSSTLSPATIYVRFVAPNVTSATIYSGTLTNAGGGATTQNITLSGTSIIANADLGVNIIVAKDGSGDYTTIQAAINAIPASHPGISPYIVYIRPGFYHEKVTVPSSLSDILIEGEHRDSTILDYDDYVGSSGTPNVPGTSSVQTIAISASNSTFKNMTIQNLVTVERAVAVQVTGSADMVTFKNCNIYGHQDTYYFWNCYRVYHLNCKITGSVDYIFGTGIAVFDSCSLEMNRNGGVVTAAATTSNFAHGFVFRNCTITALPTGFDGAPITSFYLGRPWQNNPKTVFLNCYEPATLAPAGWTLMTSDPLASVNQNTLYAEYLCYGPGSAYASRATISGNPNYGRQLTEGESAAYTLSSIFAAASKTDSPFPNGDWFPAGGNDPLPVELNAFSATVNHRTVVLNWKTATEINSNGFSIERKTANASEWKSVGFVAGAGNSNAMKEYSFTDKTLNSGKVLYRLKMIDNDGAFEYSKTVETEISLPGQFSLEQNYPNPFNPSTRIDYTLPQAAQVKLEVFNVLGERIAVLVDKTQDAGYYSCQFSAASNFTSGVYLYRLNTVSTQGKKEFTSIKKMIMTK